jgi:uncharacterized repeat protein (TIGR01451 family)
MSCFDACRRLGAAIVSCLSSGRGGLLALALAIAVPAHANPGQRVQVIQHGDFAIIGNTLAQACEAGVPAPVVGTLGACGTNTADSAPDVFWRADSPAAGQAEANTSITAAQARSTAVLNLPPGAVVTHAFLYWAATNVSGADTGVVLDRPGPVGFTTAVTAQQSWTGANDAYASMADITALVSANGNGAYRVSDVSSVELANLNGNNPFAAWWMVVLYERAADPLRSLSVYDGLDTVANGAPASITLSGFLVLTAGYAAKLGVVALEGDATITGDQLFFNGGAALSDALNPASNFFNGTRGYLGAAVSTPGDLPQLEGTAGSMSGIDIDVVDITSRIAGGQTSATVQASSTGDVYYLASMVVSITTFRPSFGNSTMTVSDLNGGVPMPGDTLEYTIQVSNDGNESSIGTYLETVLPAGITYVPGSLMVASGANAGAKTDAPGDDQAEYLFAERKIVARLGTGANGTQGGALGLGQNTTIRFQATLDSACTLHSAIASQAMVHGTGQLSQVSIDIPTDGDPATAGQQPTILPVDVDCLSVTLPPSPAHGSISSDIGFACGAGTCSTPIATGTTVNLSADADDGYVLDTWSGDCADAGTTPSLALTLDAPKTCGATFIAAPRAIRVSVSGLVGSGLVLHLDDSENLSIPGNGTFAFARVVHAGDPYGVVVASQPAAPAQVCTFSPDVPPSGTVPDADVELALACTTLQPHLRLAVSDNHAYARYGMIVGYVVTLNNDGPGDAGGVSLAAAASSQLDEQQMTWSCVGAGAGATCTAEGSGRLVDSGIALPPGRSLTWLVTAPLRQDAAGQTLDYTVDATGAGGASASDTSILVLLRTGFDVPDGDGAE